VNQEILNVLFIADIVGKPGIDIVKKHIVSIKKKYAVDLCIANGENGAGGKGLTDQMLVNISIWGFSHHQRQPYFDKLNFLSFLDKNPKVLRPINYPASVNGRGSIVVTLDSNIRVGIINAQGRTFMYPIDCPFRVLSEEINRIGRLTSVIIVDFHAEATAEKMQWGGIWMER